MKQTNKQEGEILALPEVPMNEDRSEIKGIDQNVKVNRLLWQFAQKMMELKG